MYLYQQYMSFCILYLPYKILVSNNSYNFGVNIPNIIPLNKIFEKKINRYLKTHPDEGLQRFVDELRKKTVRF